MTSNIDRAAEIIHQHHDNCTDAAAHLDLAGLLMPNLPEPVKNYDKVFRVASPSLDCRSVQAVGDQVVVHGYKARHTSIEEARRFADALYAAANHAEKDMSE